MIRHFALLFTTASLVCIAIATLSLWMNRTPPCNAPSTQSRRLQQTTLCGVPITSSFTGISKIQVFKVGGATWRTDGPVWTDNNNFRLDDTSLALSIGPKGNSHGGKVFLSNYEGTDGRWNGASSLGRMCGLEFPIHGVWQISMSPSQTVYDKVGWTQTVYLAGIHEVYDNVTEVHYCNDINARTCPKYAELDIFEQNQAWGISKNNYYQTCAPVAFGRCMDWNFFNDNCQPSDATAKQGGNTFVAVVHPGGSADVYQFIGSRQVNHKTLASFNRDSQPLTMFFSVWAQGDLPLLTPSDVMPQISDFVYTPYDEWVNKNRPVPLSLPAAGTIPCTADYGAEYPCCGMRFRDTRVPQDVRPCPGILPTCRNYIINKGVGHCY